MDIKVKYLSKYATELNYNGDWVDLKACAPVKIFHEDKWLERPVFTDQHGEYIMLQPLKLYRIPLGVAMQLPKDYEAHLKCRSSLSSRYGLICATSGIIDEGYCGDNDEWCYTAFATRKAKLYLGDRICQMRIIKKQPKLDFKTVEELGNPDRGGHGSTGSK